MEMPRYPDAEERNARVRGIIKLAEDPYRPPTGPIEYDPVKEKAGAELARRAKWFLLIFGGGAILLALGALWWMAKDLLGHVPRIDRDL